MTRDCKQDVNIKANKSKRMGDLGMVDGIGFTTLMRSSLFIPFPTVIYVTGKIIYDQQSEIWMCQKVKYTLPQTRMVVRITDANSIRWANNMNNMKHLEESRG